MDDDEVFSREERNLEPSTYRVSIGAKHARRGGSPKTDRFIPRVYVSIRARQPFEESGSCSSKSSLERSSSCSTNSVSFHLSYPPTLGKATTEASSSSASSSSCPVSRRMPTPGFWKLVASTISGGLENPSTPLRERERVSFHLAGPSRESLLVHKAVRIPGGARDPEEGSSDEKEERERISSAH